MSDPIIEENLKKLRAGYSGSFFFLPFDQIEQIANQHLTGFSLTRQKMQFDAPFDAADMAWNHLDFTHRPWIHKHYREGLRTVLGKDISLGFTPWGKLPFLVPTFDVRVSEREFLHGYNMAGLFYVFLKIKIESAAGNDHVWTLDWFILSKRYLKPIHWFLHRSMKRINAKLYEEDRPVKTRRRDLRRRGYSFINDDPDYHSATVLSPNNVRFPSAPAITVKVSDLPLNVKHLLKTGEREFLLHRGLSGEVTVWDNVCPHQGAKLEEGEHCDGFITCPWHGLRFIGMKLEHSKPIRENSLFQAKLEHDQVIITPKAP